MLDFLPCLSIKSVASCILPDVWTRIHSILSIWHSYSYHLPPDLPLDHQPFYFFRQNGSSRGDFSLVSAVACHLQLANQFNLTPIADLNYSPT